MYYYRVSDKIRVTGSVLEKIFDKSNAQSHRVYTLRLLVKLTYQFFVKVFNGVDTQFTIRMHPAAHIDDGVLYTKELSFVVTNRMVILKFWTTNLLMVAPSQ